MRDGEARYTIDELADLVGVSVRTIRFYIAEGLLPGADSRGRGPGYTEEHLLRLRLARRLVDQHLPLADARDRLAGLSVDDLRALLAEEDQRALRRRRASPKAYVSELLAQAHEARSRPPPPLPAAPSTQAQPLPAHPPRVSQTPAAQPQPSAASRAERAVAAGAMPMLERAQPAVPPATWRRFSLADGVELHVRADAERQQSPLIRRLLAAADVQPDDAKDITTP
jgi:DNA-binding transcriptional MerR regulator